MWHLNPVYACDSERGSVMLVKPGSPSLEERVGIWKGLHFVGANALSLQAGLCTRVGEG